MKIRRQVTVSGIVQGVNFRRHTEQQAYLLGVEGWVRNLPDGRVEGCFEGEEGSVLELVEWCRRGPAASRVDTIEVREGAHTGEFGVFRIRRD